MRTMPLRASVRRAAVVLLAATCATIVYAAFAASAHAYLYYRHGSSIERIALNGRGGRGKLIADPGGSVHCGLAATESHLYWANGHDIGRSDINGSRIERNWIRTASTVCGITTDAKHVYWIGDDGYVGRADLSGANVNDKFIGTSRRARPTVAVSASFIFWVDRLGIGRATLDGKNVKQEFLPADFPTTLAIQGRYLYWNNLGALFEGTTIGRAALDGTGVNQKFIDLSAVERHPCGMAAVDERLFFANWRPGNFGPDFSINFTGLSSNDVELTHFGKQFPCPSALAANPDGPTALPR